MNKILRNILGPRRRREIVEEEDIKPKRIIPVRRTSLKEVHQDIINDFTRYYPRFLLKSKGKKNLRYSFKGYKYSFRYSGVNQSGGYVIRNYYVKAMRNDPNMYELKHYVGEDNSARLEVEGPI